MDPDGLNLRGQRKRLSCGDDLRTNMPHLDCKVTEGFTAFHYLAEGMHHQSWTAKAQRHTKPLCDAFTCGILQCRLVPCLHKFEIPQPPLYMRRFLPGVRKSQMGNKSMSDVTNPICHRKTDVMTQLTRQLLQSAALKADSLHL